MKTCYRIGLIGIATLLISLTNTWGVEKYILKGEAVATDSPSPQITLSWDTQLSGYEITISKRLLGDTGAATWGTPIVTVTNPVQSYVDTNIVVGTIYEYKLYRPQYDAEHLSTTFYITSGIKAPLIEDRGKIILIVDDTIASPLAPELSRLERDLTGDGWTVIRHDSPRHGSGSATNLKAWIVAKYNEDTSNTKALFLFGRLPIVKSGYEAPDGHSSVPHETDLFYGDMNGIWTDTGTYGTTVNIPGDGIYDQNVIPDNTMELQVGRVDLAGMTAWNKSEVELLKNYLRKDHLWRHGLVADTRNGVMAYQHSGWHVYNDHNYMEHNGLHALFTTSNVVEDVNWSPEAENNPYTWGVAFGEPDGSKYTNFNFKMTFTINFGSGKQQWAYNNNPMRAILAMPDYGLTCAWGARPFWFFHHMGMGKTIGYSAYRTQNNYIKEYTPAGQYSFEGRVHVNLMGDPTLRMYAVAPPTEAAADTNALGNIIIDWTASADTIEGYHIYRSADRDGPFTRQSSNILTTTSFTDANAPAGTNFYMVRAIKLEQSASGTFYNPSQGAFASYPSQNVAFEVISATGDVTPPVGNYDYYVNTSLMCSAPTTVIGSTTQVVATGWIGTGSVPATGTNSSTPLLILTEDSSISWLWNTNVWLEVQANANGTVDASSSWNELGTNISVTASATLFRYAFSHWTGSGVPAGHETDNPLAITMDTTRTIVANFDKAPNPDNTMPYAESFEQYPANMPLTGTSGWHTAFYDAALVSTNSDIITGITEYGNSHPYPINTTHTKAAKITDSSSVHITGKSNTVVITKMLAHMLPYNGLPPDLSTNNQQISIIVTSDNHPALFHANPLSDTVGWTTITSTTIASNSWHTITFETDYTTTGIGGYHYSRVKIDNDAWLTSTNGYSINTLSGITNGPWFALFNTNITNMNGLHFGGDIQIDDILVAEDWKDGGGDDDGDGMWDMWEIHYFGNTNEAGGGATEDWDNDGVDNQSEYETDTIPTDTNSYLSVTDISMATNGIRISWQGGIEAKQYLERTEALSTTGSTWVIIQTNLPPVTITAEMLDSKNADGKSFYRVRAER